MKQTLSIHDNQKGKIKTASGIIVDLLNPTLDMINAEDIINALSNICRFGGQINPFYSVLQHSVLVCRLAPMELKKEALLHDAAEAYLGDVVSPLKHLIKDIYKPIEQRFEEVIFLKFDADIKKLPFIKQYDTYALELEDEFIRKNNMSKKKEWEKHFINPANKFNNHFWSPLEASWESQHYFEHLEIY